MDGMRPKPAKSPLDAAIARLASRQHEVVSLAQLMTSGVNRRAASHRVQAGRLWAIAQAQVLRLPIDRQPDFRHEPTRPELERRFLRLCRRHGLPKPEVNVRVGSFEIDFLWRDRSVVVETDGYRFHRGRVAFESDRARDAELKLLGYDVLRFTHRQVAWEASLVARTLRTLLS